MLSLHDRVVRETGEIENGNAIDIEADAIQKVAYRSECTCIAEKLWQSSRLHQ